MSDLGPFASAPPGSERFRQVSRDGTVHMVGGTIVGALAAYGFQVIGGRVLGTVGFAPITVLWTLLFLILTIVFLPVEQFTIRHTLVPGVSHRRYGQSVALAIGVAAVAAAGFVGLTLEHLFDDEPIYMVIAVVMMVGYGLFSIGRGLLAGRREFQRYGWATGGESMNRMLLAVAVVLLAPSAPNLGWAMALGPLTILLFRPFRADQADVVLSEEGSTPAGFLGPLMVANGASQTILAAGPLVVAALGGSLTAISIFFVTFTLFRGPLTMSYSLLARVLPPFTRMVLEGDRSRLRTWTIRLMMGTFALAALGAAAGYWVGPAVVAFLFSEEFRPTQLLAALAAGGVVLAMGALYANQIMTAVGRTSRLAGAWVVALAVAAVAVLVAPGDPSTQVGIGFLVGEAAALTAVVTVSLRSPKVRVERAADSWVGSQPG